MAQIHQQQATPDPRLTFPTAAPEAPGHTPDERRAAAAAGYEGATVQRKPVVQLSPAESPTTADPPVTEEPPATDDPEAAERARVEAARRKYEQILGGLIGGPLYDLIHTHLGPDDMLSYAQQGMPALVQQGSGLLGGLGRDADESTVIGAFSTEVLNWSGQQGLAWLQGEKGQAFLTSVNQWVEDHPGVVAASLVSAALAAGAAVYLSNLDPPNFAQTFNLGGGWQVNGALDLGPIQEWVVRSAEAGVRYQAEGILASVNVTYNEETGYVVGASGEIKTAGGTTLTGQVTANITNEGDASGEMTLGVAGESGSATVTVDTEGNQRYAGNITFLGPDGRTHTIQGTVTVDAGGKATIQTGTQATAEFEGGTATQSMNLNVDAEGRVTTERGQSIGILTDVGQFTTGTTQTTNAEGSTDVTTSMGLTGETYALNGTLRVNGDGTSLIDLSGNSQMGLLGLGLGYSHGSDGAGQTTNSTVNASLSLGTEQNHFNASGNYNFLDRQMTLSTASLFTLDPVTLGLNSSLGFGPGGFTGGTMDGTLGVGLGDKTSLGATGGAQFTGTDLTQATGGLTFNSEHFRAQLDALWQQSAGVTLSGSAGYTGGGFEAGGNFQLNATDGELLSAGARLGYTDPNAFRSFLVDYAYKRYSDAGTAIDQHRIGAQVNWTISEFLFRANAGLVLENNQFNNVNGQIIGASPELGPLRFLAGVGGSYSQVDGGLLTLYGGAQFNNVPILFGYTPQTQAVSIGVTIPFPTGRK